MPKIAASPSVAPSTVAPVAPSTVTPLLALWPHLAAGALAALALGGAVLLWAHYGTTVFFETIRAGFAACFG
jgi:hypothetical protein